MVLDYPADYQNWDKLGEHCQYLEGLSQLEKEKGRQAFEFLKKELGEGFLREIFGARHPLESYIANTAAWTRRWLIWFAEAINDLKRHGNFDSLLFRLRDPGKFLEGLSVLDVGHKLSQVGFGLSFDQKIDVSGHRKTPDIRALDVESKEEFYVEVSILNGSLVQKNAMETLDGITQVFWSAIPFLRYSGRIHKTLSRSHLDEIRTKVSEELSRVSKEGGFRELNISGVLDLAMASETGMQLLEKWVAERGLVVGQMTGPAINVDEVFRVKRKIEAEQRQLPIDKPNVLVVMSNDVFWGGPDIAEKINHLEEAVYEYPHLLCAVVSGRYMGVGESRSIMKDQHVFTVKPRTDLHVEQHLILLNKYCAHKVYPRTITKIYNGFH